MRSKFLIQAQRGPAEIIVDLLETVNKHPGISKTKAASYCSLSSNRYGLYFDFLVKHGFLNIQEGHGEFLYLTGKGRMWLLKAEEVLAAVA